jgi:hypothetical protein
LNAKKIPISEHKTKTHKGPKKETPSNLYVHADEYGGATKWIDDGTVVEEYPDPE